MIVIPSSALADIIYWHLAKAIGTQFFQRFLQLLYTVSQEDIISKVSDMFGVTGRFTEAATISAFVFQDSIKFVLPHQEAIIYPYKIVNKAIC